LARDDDLVRACQNVGRRRNDDGNRRFRLRGFEHRALDAAKVAEPGIADGDQHRGFE